MKGKETKPVAVVVNDDVTQCDLLVGLLVKAGIQTQAFVSVEAALATMGSANPPDLIVTDLYMPGIDGWRFCRLLRSPEYAEFNGIPILVVSATFAGDHSERIAADVGADAFLSSPVDGKVFTAMVLALIAGKKDRRLPRVLIVEDDRALADLLRRVLAAHGYQEDAAFSIREAKEAFSKESYDVVVLDYHLPDGAADELLEDFRAARPDCACVMVTGDASPGLALNWMKRGAAAYLRKPFSPEELIELCDRARRERSLLRTEDLLEIRTRELRENEEKYRSVFTASPDGIWVHGVDGAILDANETMCRRIGLPREALVGRNIREFITPNSAAGMADNVRGVLDGRAHVFETTHLSTTGMAFEVEVHESRIMWESRAAILSISRDITERKRVAEEHRQVQALLESAMAQSPAGIIIADAPDVAIRWANPAALSIRGESGLPLTGIEVGRHASRWQTFRPDGRFYPSEDLPLSRAVLKGETTRGEEVVIRHASGEDRWVSVNAAPIRDAAGAVTAGIVVFADITVQKEIEEAERLARTDRELIGRLATAAIQVQDILRFQQEMSRLLGEALDVSRIRVCVYHHDKRTMDSTAEWTAPGVAPKSDGLQGVPPDADLWLMAALMRGEPVRVTDVADIPDGRAVDVMRARGIQSVFVIPLFIGTRFCGYMRLDECRRRREWTAREQSLLAEAVRILMGVWADEDLRCSEERFRGILRNVATVAVQGYSMDGIVRYWNRTSEIFYGYTAEEAMGRNLLDLIIPPAMRDGMRAAMRNMVATGEVIPASELVVMRKDGSSIPVYSSYAIVKIPGRDPELFCIDVDLSDLKRVEMEREKYQTQLAQAQKMESVGRLAGGVAHDFNNMLQAIVGNAELALERMGSNDPLRPVLEEIVKVASRSSDLTRQLLAYARKQAVAPKVLDLNETVADLLKMLRRLIGEDIALNWKPGGALWPVLMDPAQVDAILANLCVNARDAITGTGTITVETGNIVLGADNGFRHTGRLPGDCVWLAVRDDGCGMDAETRSHLFEPFFTTKETGKGTGLGLATVYGVVEQNRGFIDVVSEPGRGTTITIYLPRHVVAAAPVVEECKSQMAGGGETILVVEDEASVLEVTAMTLKSLGYAVLTAATPGEAIRLAREYAGRIDMLLTDVVMPGMNGRDLAETVTSICPGIRRLFMSGYTADVIARQGILDEGVHFIQKPFGKAVLAEKLRKMLARSESGKGGGCLKE